MHTQDPNKQGDSEEGEVLSEVDHKQGEATNRRRWPKAFIIQQDLHKHPHRHFPKPNPLHNSVPYSEIMSTTRTST
ncbi:hypothetical protein CgunFtcFv8_018051 [Champsocephalus gunnari]|uniref:Uncharacterized protein n=1 Tax=Champsocephalus gunnari TaxID=52237 RepID=A0AAN8DNX0_CHAGU|nr:hypothetical protein CgunFtcFv8_018051 [Champsocephalus gunnari]